MTPLTGLIFLNACGCWMAGMASKSYIWLARTRTPSENRSRRSGARTPGANQLGEFVEIAAESKDEIPPEQKESAAKPKNKSLD